MELFTRIPARYFYIALIFLAMLPAGGCKKVLGSHDAVQSPLSIFDEAWQVMDRRYALFSVKRINWDSTRLIYRSMVKDNMSKPALFKLLSEMIAVLKDGHVALTSPTDTAVYLGFYSGFLRNFNYTNIVTNYLKNSFQTVGPAIYKVENNLGYIYYNSFDNAISGEQLDSIMLAMSNTKGLIIDVRGNNGGNSRNAEALFSRFITIGKTVKYEVYKSGPAHNDLLEPAPYTITPAARNYLKPVCVLVNRGCYSTCNDFALYMSGLPQAVLVGDQTGGGGGIPVNYLLANGWKLQYTSSITLSPEKKSIENGILPAINAFITEQDETNGKDPILEKAIQLLQ